MVEEKTISLKKQMWELEEIPDRVNLMKDWYKDETCYIVTAGPSLKNFEKEWLRERLKNNLVFTLKQSYFILEEVCDFHIVNFTNFQPYDYEDNDKTIVAWEVFEEYHPQMILENNFKVDLMLPVVRNHGGFENTQAAKLDFDDFTLDKTLNRAWGPGLMYEMALPIAIHLGVKEIITVGWDIGDLSKFSGKENREEQWQDHFYEGSDKIQYAKTPMLYEEVGMVINAVPFVKEWLETKGIDLKICSDRNPADESIERVEL